MYRIEYASRVVDDLAGVRPYDRSRVTDRIDTELADTPTLETRHRKPLVGLRPPWDQELPVWELRVGDYRVFYDVEEKLKVVTVLAIRFKPPHKTTEDIL